MHNALDVYLAILSVMAAAGIALAAAVTPTAQAALHATIIAGLR